VSTYRRMRRHAFLARRSGLQPMMVINTADSFPETVAVLLLRGAWRYRSELAPLAVTAGLVAARQSCTADCVQQVPYLRTLRVL